MNIKKFTHERTFGMDYKIVIVTDTEVSRNKIMKIMDLINER